MKIERHIKWRVCVVFLPSLAEAMLSVNRHFDVLFPKSSLDKL